MTNTPLLCYGTGNEIPLRGVIKMEKLKRADRSAGLRWVLLAGIGLIMLGLNWMTPLLADDYTYVHSWADWKRITSPLQIPASMYAHGFKMNGRIVAHAFEQLFLIYPKHLFDFCNAGMAVWLLSQCCAICCPRSRRSALILLFCAMALWVFLPVFGQVCLWQDGSVNYLWALVFGLFSLKPFLKSWLEPDAPPMPVWQRCLFLVFSLLYGMYSEVTSFAVILMELGLLIACSVRRKSWRSWLWLAAALSAVGFVIMATMPSEVALKTARPDLRTMLRQMLAVAKLVWARFWPLIAGWVVTMALALLRRTDGRRQLVSLAFALGAAASCCVLSAASYVPLRCLCTCALFLTVADGILLADLMEEPLKPVVLILCAALAVWFVPRFRVGIADNFESHRQWLNQKAAIDHAIETGETDLVLERLHPGTEYSAAYELAQPSTKKTKTWPNRDMAEYYGLDTILGK